MKRDFPFWFIALIIVGLSVSTVPTAAHPVMVSMCKGGQIKLIMLVDGDGIPKTSDDDCQLKAWHVAADGRKRGGVRQL